MVDLLLLDSSFRFKERTLETPCFWPKTVLAGKRYDFPMGTVRCSSALIFVPSARFESL